MVLRARVERRSGSVVFCLLGGGGSSDSSGDSLSSVLSTVAADLRVLRTGNLVVSFLTVADLTLLGVVLRLSTSADAWLELTRVTGSDEMDLAAGFFAFGRAVDFVEKGISRGPRRAGGVMT